MKKLNIALLVSVFTLSVGMMTYGVFAAAKQTLNFTSTVTFMAKDCQLKVLGKITTSRNNSFVSQNSGFYDITTSPPTQLSSVGEDAVILDTNGSSNSIVNLNLNIELNDPGIGFIPVGSMVTLTYTITNKNETNLLYFVPLDLGLSSTYADYFSMNIQYGETEGEFAPVEDKIGYSIAGGGTSVLKIELTTLVQIESNISGPLFASDKDFKFQFYNSAHSLEDVVIE